jgi:hypothetical protein
VEALLLSNNSNSSVLSGHAGFKYIILLALVLAGMACPSLAQTWLMSNFPFLSLTNYLNCDVDRNTGVLYPLAAIIYSILVGSVDCACLFFTNSVKLAINSSLRNL